VNDPPWANAKQEACLASRAITRQAEVWGEGVRLRSEVTMKDKGIPDKMYFRIGETADILGVKPYVLRYWETEFPDIKPVKSQSNQRLYKRRDVELLMAIKHLLYDEKFTINGARLHLKDLMKAQSKTEAEAPDGELFSPAPKSQPEARAAQPVTGDVKKVLSKIKGELNWCLSEIRK